MLSFFLVMVKTLVANYKQENIVYKSRTITLVQTVYNECMNNSIQLTFHPVMAHLSKALINHAACKFLWTCGRHQGLLSVPSFHTSS